MDLALNNLQWLICHKTQPNNLCFVFFLSKKQGKNTKGWIDIFGEEKFDPLQQNPLTYVQ